MLSQERIFGRISALTGAAALLLAALWYLRSWDDGFTFPPLPTNDITDLTALFGFWFLAVAFEFGVPILGLVSTLFGLPARHDRMSRIGLACAIFALLLYVSYIKLCSAALLS